MFEFYAGIIERNTFIIHPAMTQELLYVWTDVSLPCLISGQPVDRVTYVLKNSRTFRGVSRSTPHHVGDVVDFYLMIPAASADS